MLGCLPGGVTGYCEQALHGLLPRPEREMSAVDLLPGMSDRIEGTDAHRRPSPVASDREYRPRRPKFFNPGQIILSKGSFDDSRRRELGVGECASRNRVGARTPNRAPQLDLWGQRDELVTVQDCPRRRTPA